MPTASTVGEGKIAYVDLYAGPGRYEDGAASTPLLVLEKAIEHPKMSQMLVTFFNDVDKNLTDTLQSEIDKLPGIGRLKHKPRVQCNEVDQDAEEFFTKTNLVLPFIFKSETGSRTTHSLVFVSKHFKGYEIMKEIMARESSVEEQGVPSFTYSPADASMPLLFSLNTPLDKLEERLRRDFAGRALTMLQIYKEHSIDRRYIKRNYKTALLNLEQAGTIAANPPLKTKASGKGRRSGTFADDVSVTFPARTH